MSKKILLIMALIIVSVLCAYSQTYFAGKIAGGITNVSDGTVSIGPKFGLQLGGVLTHNFGERFGIQAEALYSMKGAESEDIPPVKFNFTYFEIPITAKFKVGTLGANFSRINVNAGIYAAFKISGEVEYNGEAADADGLESTDIGAVFGMDAFITRNICLDLRYNLGFSTITTTGTGKNIGILLGISYYFD